MSTKKLYAEIDVRAKDAEGWPAVVPAMTEDEAIRAARRLWRYSLGQTFTGVVKVTSGNRRNRIAWAGSTRAIHVNPSRGWKHLVHELSHWLDYVANGTSQHGKHHARFEAKLVREVVRRGYLDGKLATPDKPEPAPLPAEDAKLLGQRKKLDALLARAARWEAKRKRAENALKKIGKSARYYERAIEKAAADA